MYENKMTDQSKDPDSLNGNLEGQYQKNIIVRDTCKNGQ